MGTGFAPLSLDFPFGKWYTGIVFWTKCHLQGQELGTGRHTVGLQGRRQLHLL